MSKAGEKDQQGSDLDGRVMALEQSVRGLNARICAIERSVSADLKRSRSTSPPQGIDPEIPAVDAGENDDFVPASSMDAGCQMPTEQRNGDSAVPVSGLSGQCRETGWHTWLQLGTIDVTGLIAGAMLVIISILLSMDNVELLKNPLTSLVFGVLLIATVCIRKFFR